MNTNQLKKFAQDARRKLLQQVSSRMELVLTTDSAELREKAVALNNLKEAIKDSSKEQVIDKVAYTWFNRLMALRFMDANEYQPSGIRMVTPKDGFTLPEILEDARQGQMPDELPVNKERIYDLLDGKIPSTNAQNEVYKELLIGACNQLNSIFPFLFEKIDDYTELLLPDDLTSEFSIVHDFVEGMQQEDCKDVEIIGWLYQFYISERKDELINAKKRYKADELAPVTQLFTPKWIVQYMVDNTLGQLWKEARPNTTITNGLEFYIKPNNPELIPSRDLKSVEDIRFFDPCVGSAHVLCYAYDIFYKMYEEEGYNPSDIPELIITKNLYGIDIDDRAAQLANFALMMKGREHQRRFFRKNIVPNVTAFQNIESHPKFENAKVLGSLIKITPEEVNDIEVDETSLFVQRDIQIKKQASLLANKYDIVVTNPPYLNSTYMEGSLKQFTEKEYKVAKSDLFACFFLQAGNLTKQDGLVGLISPFVWMFISSYEKLRKEILFTQTISSLIQLEYNAFGPAMVPVCTFILRNQFVGDYKGSYVKLSDFTGAENQASKTLEAIQNPDCGWFYNANQKYFEKIPGSPIGYWISGDWVNYFDQNRSLSENVNGKSGMSTCDNDRFMRLWTEVACNKMNTECSSHEEGINSGRKWFPYGKGGSYRKWYGNYFFVVNWENDGNEIKKYVVNNPRDPKTTHWSRRIFNTEHFFKIGITYSDVSSSDPAFRLQRPGIVFSGRGPLIISDDLNLIAFLNCKIAREALRLISPTLTFNIGDILKLPYHSHLLDVDLRSMITDSKEEWDSREASWDFKQNELVRIKGQNLEEANEVYQQYWKNKFFQLHKNEEELNKQFIDIYGLQNELTPDVPLEDITILKEETKIINNQLVFQADEVFQQFMSYAVGCMFGRYSLDKVGLILAKQGETLEDYLEKVYAGQAEPVEAFLPDDDNIIPVLDDEWFEDDIVNRFYEFLKGTFGKANFEKNLAFVEECLGKDIRKYFVKDFYKDHVKRYKKRPIYWMFSSPKGSFNVLIYMHRYTPDSLNNILNGYLVEYREKLKSRIGQLDHVIESGSPAEQTRADKNKDKLNIILLELQEYEREILYPLATERISIDLDDGVLVNYNKFGKAIKDVAGLNDKKTKDKVRKFDWVDVEQLV